MAEVSERRRFSPKASVYADVVVELTQITLRHLVPTILLTGTGLAGTTALLSSRYHDRWLWLFTILIAALTLARAGLALTLPSNVQQQSAITLRGAVRWQLNYAIGTLLFCLTMAACTLYSFREHDSTAWTLCTLGTFMLCAGLAARAALYSRLLQVSGLAMLFALALAVLTSPDPVARIGVVLICLFAFLYYQSVQSRFDTVIDQIRSRRTLSLLSENDALTGLANRRHFEGTLATTCLIEAPFAILFISMDRFKAVNENYGIAVGDILLQRVGVRLRGSVRRGDIVARVGGDEFAILQIHGACQQSAESLARRIHRAIAAPFEIDHHPIHITIHISIRVSTPEDKNPETLLDRSRYTPYPASSLETDSPTGRRPTPSHAH